MSVPLKSDHLFVNDWKKYIKNNIAIFCMSIKCSTFFLFNMR